MRIALVSHEYPPGLRSGGIGTYTEKTARALARLGQDVHVFTEGADAAPSGVSAAHVHRLPASGARPDEHRVVRRAWTVARALWKKGPFDVVQACEWDAEAVIYALYPKSIVVTRLATPSYFVHRLNGAPARTKLRTAVVGPLERLQTRRSHHIISPSRCLADLVGRDWGLDPDRISIVPTGIEVPAGFASAPPPSGLGDRSYVLYFGRLEARKGIKTWIDALPKVLIEDPDLWAVFAGLDLGISGTPFQEYARQRLGSLMDRVIFLPRLAHQELFPLVAGATLVVLPSIWESFPNGALEAMALGRPVVATFGSGFPELIEDGVSGFLVEPGDCDRLAAGVIGALANRMRLRRVGQAAGRRARDFDLDKMATRLLGVYRDLVERPQVLAAVDAVR